MLRIVVLISGRGSNLKAILDARLPVEIAAVISSRTDATGISHARAAGIDTRVVSKKDFANNEAFCDALAECIDGYLPDLVVLAGFMHILANRFVQHYADRMINIHPSLLPAFRGLRTHEQALQAGVTEHGASVHLVTEELDAGQVIAQVRVPVLEGDSASELAARVLRQEHRLYPEVIRWIAGGRITLEGNRVIENGRPLQAPLIVEAVEEETS